MRRARPRVRAQVPAHKDRHCRSGTGRCGALSCRLRDSAFVWRIYTDSNLYCIVAPGLLSSCCVSQPQRSFSYAIGFLPCRPIKSLAALDAIKLYISIISSFIRSLNEPRMETPPVPQGRAAFSILLLMQSRQGPVFRPRTPAAPARRRR